MEWGMVGVSHRDTPMEVLNRTHLSGTQMMELYARIREETGAQSVAVSTCNRTEIYYAHEDPQVHARMAALFVSLFPQAAATMRANRGRDTLVRLLRVAAGLESLVAGEDQILGQLVEAHAFAMREQEEMKTLGRIFQGAFAAAKRIKTRLCISSVPLSVSYIGIKLLRERCGVAGKTALVLGAGKMSRLAVEYLLEDGAARVTVCSRTARALEGIDDARVTFCDFARRYELLAGADLCVTATSAPHTVLEAQRVPVREKPLFVLDLAMPYDADPRLAERADVALFNMETLEEISRRNARRRDALCAEAGELIESEADALLTGLHRMKAQGVIVHLGERCDALTRDAMTYLSRSLPLTARESAVVERALHAALRKLTSAPVHALKRLDGDALDGCVAAAEYLFGLRGAGDGRDAAERDEKEGAECI